jgi:ATP-binding cassette, subfamily B, bacterial
VSEESADDMESPYWRLSEDDTAVSLRQLMRRLPEAARPVLAIVRHGAPGAALLVVMLQLASGAAFAFGLLATTDVLGRLLAAGPTPQRLLAGLPGLVLVIGACASIGLLNAGVSLAKARIGPAVRRVAEEWLLDAALSVDLAAYDDAAFYDRLHRARDCGLYYLERATDNLAELIGAAFAVLAAGGSLGVLHPVLLPLLALGTLPDGWAVLRAARLGYANIARTVTLHRRVLMLSELATEREPAAEIRACQAGPFVLDEYRRVTDMLRDQEIGVGVTKARARAVGRSLAGLCSGATYLVLGLLLHAGWISLAVGGTAVIAIRSATAALGRLVLAANQLFEQGLYVADYQAFRTDARTRARPVTGRAAPIAPRRISLRQVDFRYRGPETGDTLHDINMTIHSGQTIALVGENGSGKTTLAKLIAGLYLPTGGRIDWDGTDLAELDPTSVADRW